jgi:putative chitinase
MDAKTLSEAMGGTLSLDRYAALLPAFETAMRTAGINTPLRAAHFCAQLAHESVGLKYQSEIWGPTAAQLTYNGRMDNRPGTDDWSRFRGHGWIQITGRDNHTAVSKWAHGKGLVPTATYFVDHPEALGDDQHVGIGPAWYWTVARPQLNSLCDRDDVVAVTKSINGGTNGLADRQSRLARCKALGSRLLPGKQTSVQAVEKVLDYSRAEIGQDTYYWCGPATTQTIIQARTGQMAPEATLAKELGTTVNGTNGVVQLARVLNARIGGNWQTGAMPNDPPHAEEKETLWKRIVASINGGVGVAANIWVPPSNYPKASYTSTESLRYGGGFVMHYLAVMGYARDAGGVRHVWLADSGFAPHGSWVTFDQFATMIPPREYAWASAWATDTSEGEDDMTPEDRELLKQIRDNTADCRSMLMTLSAQDMGDAKITGPYGGWPQTGGRTRTDLLGAIAEKLGVPGTSDSKEK